ncbi:hypothetical protein [Undibacterium sp. WLX3042]|uniref:hypothetical protein n=1 Tax=Undibacterium sp. WLX3042 TaxID=3412686 RepID=UPI003C30044A
MPAFVKSAQTASPASPAATVTAASVTPAATVLIATDVFGITPAVQSLVRQLSVNALIISPFQDTERQFRSEQDAYQAFIAEGGVARYTEKLNAILQQRSGLKHAIGFSAGASALWISSQHEFVRSLQNMVLFYGSRIRDHREIRPVCPVRLIFAEQEAAFDPAGLVSDLRQRGHTAELAKATRHGFMNAYSRGCCVKSQTRYSAELFALLHPASGQAAA